MRSIRPLLMSAVVAALVLVGAGGAQPPFPKQDPGRGPGRPAPPGVDEIVERIMSFDKNKDGKVTRDELPERMQFLIDRGDTNKDGALDRDEIRKLAATLAPAGGFGGRAGGFGVGPDGGFAAGGRVEGFGGGPVTIGAGPGPGVGPISLGFPGPGPGLLEGVVDDLKLASKKKDQALAAVNAHQENVRKLMEQERASLLKKMKEILSEEELKDFAAALDRPRGGTVFIGPDAPRPGGGGDVERRIDQLQKELDDLRRQLRR
jgi:hypothetical protein